MKYSLLLLLVFGFVAFTFAAPANEEENQDEPDQKDIEEDPEESVNNVAKVENDEDENSESLSVHMKDSSAQCTTKPKMKWPSLRPRKMRLKNHEEIQVYGDVVVVVVVVAATDAVTGLDADVVVVNATITDMDSLAALIAVIIDADVAAMFAADKGHD
ncbi:hypothetical protein AC249_AIPGENE8643 [Exaiptasia diaphana]|nr:hypothetical protein AC249_AIPGENE8643 [Exaiptasia diaphana]